MRWLFIIHLFATQALAQDASPARPTDFAAIPIVITTNGIMHMPPQRTSLPGWVEPDPALDQDIPRPPQRAATVLSAIVDASTPPDPATRPGAPTRQSLPTVARQPQPDPVTPLPPVAQASGGACYRELERLNVRFTRLPNSGSAGGCNLTGAVEVTAIDGVVLGPPGKLTCPAALATAQWVRDSVRPEGQRILGSRLTKIEQWSTYSCRRRPSGRLSEHATGNAIDVARLLFADGRRLSIEPDWYAGGNVGRYLQTISRSSCRYFSVVLDPTSDAAHQNHLHLDKGRWKSCPYD